MQSVIITTSVVCSNHTYGKVYSIQRYVIKFVSDLRQVDGFLRHDITEIMLKVALNTKILILVLLTNYHDSKRLSSYSLLLLIHAIKQLIPFYGLVCPDQKCQTHNLSASMSS
jgi:hypothetical protein